MRFRCSTSSFCCTRYRFFSFFSLMGFIIIIPRQDKGREGGFDGFKRGEVIVFGLQFELGVSWFIYCGMSFSESQRGRLDRVTANAELPVTYFNLVERVGDIGKYQLVLLLIFMICWFATGIILLSTAFLFRNRSFDCKPFGLLVSDADCTSYVCELPEHEWTNYLALEDNSFESLATEDNYLCSNSAVIDLVSSCTYFGAFVGYIAISFFSDNFGRKTSMLVSWGICTVGTIIVLVSQNIYMVAVGLFFSGCGSDAAINICFFFFGEVVGDKKRQKYSVFVQIFFTLGAMTITLFFSLIDSWRVNWGVLVVGPAVIELALIYFYVEETPQFLVKKGVNATLKAMNRIGRINLGLRQALTEQDVQNVIQAQVADDFKDKYITPVDLCRFPSLRIITITCSIISFMTYAMYYGPALIIDDIGFDIYISSYMVNLSELITFLPAYLFIEKIERRTVGMILFLVAICSSLALLFIQKPEGCDLCLESVLELIIVFIFRGAVSFFFCFFQVYACELYPGRARGMGVGIVSAVGTLASTSSPIYLGYLRRNGINVMNFFVLFGIIAIGNLTLLYETKGRPLKEEIDEIELDKQKRRSQIQSIKASKLSMSQQQKSQLTYDKLKGSKNSRSNA